MAAMTQREYHIWELLQEADEFAYVPEDKSDLFALAPPHIGEGLLRFPGEYSTMDENGIEAHLTTSMETGNWEFIPLSREWLNEPQ